MDGYPGLAGSVRRSRTSASSEALAGSEEGRHRPPLRRGPRRPPDEGGRDQGGGRRSRRARRREHRASRRRRRRSRSRSTWRAAQEYGVKPGDVRRAAATLVSGIGVGSLFEEQKVFDVVVWGTPETRQQPEQRPRAVDRHAGRRPRATRPGRRRAHQPEPDRDRAARGLALRRRRRQRRRPRSATMSRTTSRRPRRCRLPARVPRRGPGRPRVSRRAG